MSHVVVDDLSDPGPWRPLTPTGQASAAISIARGPLARLGGPTLEISGTPQAQGHRVERTLPALDLTPFTDLELWIRSDRVADGSEARPFFLELRLGSAQLEVGEGDNTWHRLIPVAAADVWQPVPLALEDLAADVRGALTQLRFTCVDATVPFSMQLDRVLAFSAELLADVDEALRDRLGGTLQVEGAAVPAVVEPAAAPDGPYLRLRNYAIRPAPERSPSGGVRSDYTEHGFSIRPPAVPVDLFYAIEAVADDRAGAAALLEHALAELTPRSTLDVAGRPLPVEWVEGPPLELAEAPSRPAVHVRVGTSQRARAAREPAVPPFNRVDVEVDTRASA